MASRKNNGPVLGPVGHFEIAPTLTGWKITAVHRTPSGGIAPQITELPKLEGVLAYIKSVVAKCGVERPRR